MRRIKDIWEYGCTGGEYVGRVLDDILVSVPYADQLPLEGVRVDGEPLAVAGQTFDPKLGQWIVLVNALDHNDLNSLEMMHETLEHKNDNLKRLSAKLILNDAAIKQEDITLKEKADGLVQTNSRVMLISVQNGKDIAEIKRRLNSEGSE